jgi:hypothetical protein
MKLKLLICLLTAFLSNVLLYAVCTDTIFVGSNRMYNIDNQYYNVRITHENNIYVNDSIIYNKPKEIDLNNFVFINHYVPNSNLIIGYNYTYKGYDSKFILYKIDLIEGRILELLTKTGIRYLFCDNENLIFQKMSGDMVSNWPVFKFNLITSVEEKLFDYPYYLIENFINTNSKTIFISGPVDDDGILYCQDKSIIFSKWNKMDNSFKLLDNYSPIPDFIRKNSLCNSYFYTDAFCNDGVFTSNNNTIINENFEEIGNYLPNKTHFPIYNRGYVLTNNTLNGFYVNSIIDSIGRGKTPIAVTLNTNVTTKFEMLAYYIYNDISLSQYCLTELHSGELRLLRNFVFAKHNYGFKDKYLQAFFNLYHFYSFTNPKNRNRLSDVSHLLTEADKANIALIRAAEARVKE